MHIAYYQSIGQMLDAGFRDENDHLFYDQRNEFVRQAKRDLGIPSDERPVRAVAEGDDPSETALKQQPLFERLARTSARPVTYRRHVRKSAPGLEMPQKSTLASR